MILFPEFTENNEKGVTLFFDASDKNENELISELESVYPCLSAVKTVLKNGKNYIAVYIDDEN
ncbi:MAG: hypothetical protein J1E34_05760 [Oscillospiraceae bacterium]|nr:hypothetical protein [Oscillospiraceae bacterium]